MGHHHQSEPGKIFVKKHIRKSKYDALVEEAELLHANTQYAHMKLSNGRETTVSIKDLAPTGEQPFSEEEKANNEESGMTVLLMKVTGILTFYLCLPTKITGQQSIVSDPYIIVRKILLIHKRCVVILNICMRSEVKSIETYCVNPSKNLIVGVNVIIISYMFFCFSSLDIVYI